jgi:hypothetical protein
MAIGNRHSWIECDRLAVWQPLLRQLAALSSVNRSERELSELSAESQLIDFAFQSIGKMRSKRFTILEERIFLRDYRVRGSFSYIPKSGAGIDGYNHSSLITDNDSHIRQSDECIFHARLRQEAETACATVEFNSDR